MSLWNWLVEDHVIHAPMWVNLCSGFGIYAICNRIVKLEEAVKALKAGKK